MTDCSWSLPPDLDVKVRANMAELREQDVVRRIWAGDSSVWSGGDEHRWLGWLRLPAESGPVIPRLEAFSHSVVRERVSDLVLLGMGGSSLAPDVLRLILGTREGHPTLHVVDSTDPAQIAAVERQIDFERTLFLVASKSGSTLEVNILKQYFFQQALEKFGENAGRRFVLTTDPGSKLEQVAAREHFREMFPGVPSVGGRYSALSNFGMVPAAAMGADVATLFDRADAMARRCEREGDENPGLQLGVILGVLAAGGRDKPTLIAPAALAGFGSWLEQLIAESLGKHGKGIIPIDGEMPGPPAVYGADRVFVHLRSLDAPDPAADAHADRLEAAGQPVVRIAWRDSYDVGAEFYRWEFATAVMGAVLRVNPFDQPDVEASKVVTRRLAAEYEKTGKLPQDAPIFEGEGIALFTDARNGQTLGACDSLRSYLQVFLRQLRPGDYFALLAFIEMTSVHETALNAIRLLVRDRARVATTVGFGPRYLHSTGQAHKGGPNSGVFLQITADHPTDLPVPGQKYGFATIELAQASGDLEVLSERGRRLLRAHLRDVDRGLAALHKAVDAVLT